MVTAVLQDARDRRLAELSDLYREAQREYEAGNFRDTQRVFQSLSDHSDAKHKSELTASKEQQRIDYEAEVLRNPRVGDSIHTLPYSRKSNRGTVPKLPS